MNSSIFIRHGESTTNIDDLSFGNLDAPLTEEGIRQVKEARQILIDNYGITPEEYKKSVVASRFKRAQQSAMVMGFKNIVISPLLNESEIYNRPDLKDVKLLEKHSAERWLPEEELAQGVKLHDAIARGELPYDIFFGHGMVFAGLLMHLDELEKGRYHFDENRGFILPQAGIVEVHIPKLVE